MVNIKVAGFYDANRQVQVVEIYFPTVKCSKNKNNNNNTNTNNNKKKVASFKCCSSQISRNTYKYVHTTDK